MKHSHLFDILIIAVGAATDAFFVPSSTKRLVVVTQRSCVQYPVIQPNTSQPRTDSRTASTRLLSSRETISLELEKPLGLILEEDDELGSGVIVTQVNEGGSAYKSSEASKLIGSKIQSVTGKDVSALSFDDAMDVIVSADSPLDVVFALKNTLSGSVEETLAPVEEDELGYAIGTDVLITVQQPEANKSDIVLNAKIGDNLRKALLSNKEIELYRGIKKKLGNCGGGGQCGFCAVELTDHEGCWGKRSDYEAQKIGKNGSNNCRLACMNNIVGPATIKTL